MRLLHALAASALVHCALVAAVFSSASRSQPALLFVDLTQEGAAAAPENPGTSAPPGLPRRTLASTRALAPPAPPAAANPMPAPSRAPKPTGSADSQVSRAPAEPPPAIEGGLELDAGVSALAPEAVGGSAPTAAQDGRIGGVTADAPDGGGAFGARAGQEMALAIPGPGSGPAANAPAVEYGGYLARLREWVQEALRDRYPATARRRGLVGTVEVELKILPSGAIGAVTVVGSSSHDVLDDAAVETIKSLRRLPFPPELPARELRVRLPVVFRLE